MGALDVDPGRWIALQRVEEVLDDPITRQLDAGWQQPWVAVHLEPGVGFSTSGQQTVELC